MIENRIGEVQSIVSLRINHVEDTNYIDDKWIEFAPKEVVEKKVKVEGEEGEEAEAEQPPAEEGENKAPKYDPNEFRWTDTDKRMKNLPQVFKDFKGINCNCDVKHAESYSPQTFEAIAKSLDEFCGRVSQSGTNNIYSQIIFKEWLISLKYY